MKLTSWIIPCILVSAITEAASIASTVVEDCLSEDLGIEKRGLFKKLACIRGKSDGSGAYGSRGAGKKSTGSCAQDFEKAYSEVMADTLSVGEDSAYDTMREKLIMILTNLKAVQSQFGDSDDLEELVQEDRVATLTSAASSFKSCKSHFEGITASDWEWFFKMANSKNGILKDRHRKVFQCHFNLVRLSLENCAQRFGVSGLNLDQNTN